MRSCLHAAVRYAWLTLVVFLIPALAEAQAERLCEEQLIEMDDGGRRLTQASDCKLG